MECLTNVCVQWQRVGSWKLLGLVNGGDTSAWTGTFLLHVDGGVELKLARDVDWVCFSAEV